MYAPAHEIIIISAYEQDKTDSLFVFLFRS